MFLDGLDIQLLKCQGKISYRIYQTEKAEKDLWKYFLYFKIRTACALRQYMIIVLWRGYVLCVEALCLNRESIWNCFQVKIEFIDTVHSSFAICLIFTRPVLRMLLLFCITIEYKTHWHEYT